MSPKIAYYVLAGLIFFGACSLAFANPAPQASHDEDVMQNDDEYDYSDDQSVPDSHTKPAAANATSGMVPYFEKDDITVSTIVGNNVTLKCPAKNITESNVILWYKNGNIITTDKSVVSSGYALDQVNFGLTILNVTEASQGKFVCEVLPQRTRMNTNLIVSEHPIEAVLSESSTSAQESLHLRTTSLLMPSVIGIFLFLRI